MAISQMDSYEISISQMAMDIFPFKVIRFTWYDNQVKSGLHKYNLAF
jgi:hypothetical protein